MTIKSIQKVIKVGPSLAVTIPAKDARHAGIIAGQEVEIYVKTKVFSTPSRVEKVSKEYEAFKSQYGSTLKNLANR